MKKAILFTLIGAAIVAYPITKYSSSTLFSNSYSYNLGLLFLSSVLIGVILGGIVASILKVTLKKDWDYVFNITYGFL